MNMDIKDLIAKLKKGKGSGEKSRNGGIVAFFDKNPKMKIIIPAVLLLIALLVSLIIIFTTEKNPIKDIPADGSGNGEQVDMLPQDVREIEDIELDGENVFDEVDVSHAKITAIMVNSDGYYTATMITDTQSYPHLQVGDYIGGSSWLVEDITDSKVTIALGDKKVDLKFEF